MRSFVNGAGPRGEGAIAQLDLFEDLPLFVSLMLSEEVLQTKEVLPGSTDVVFVLDPLEANRHAATCS
jgi:hypothetical protein